MENKEINNLLNEKKKEIDEIKANASQMDLKDYYLNQYQEMFSSILQNRSLEVEHDMQEIDEEIKNLTNSMDSLDNQIKLNEENSLKVKDLENQIYQLFSQIEEARFELDNKQNKLKKDSIALFEAHFAITSLFHNALNKYYQGLISNGELLKAIDDLSLSLNDKGFLISCSIKENEKKLKENEKEFVLFEEKEHQKIDAIITEKQMLEKKIIASSIDSKEKIKEELSLRIEHKRTYLNELIASFNELSVKQLKEFNDLYIKNRLTLKEIPLQIEEYDNLFKRFKTKLLTVDTKTNQEIKKQKYLTDLLNEKKRLDTLKQKKQSLEEQKGRLNSLYAISSETVLELEKHLNDIKLEINNYKHHQFMHLEEGYDHDLALAKTNIELLEQELNSLNDERTYQLFNPDALKIKEIDKAILEKEHQLNDAINEYNHLKDEFAQFMKDEENIALKNLLNDGKYFEENIPRIKNLLEKLLQRIESINAQIMALALDLNEYQDILSKIEELQNESNN